ncbi:hypothetical protein BGZ72_000408 [Mortierella alpina]|nr:hypothetical protein BGZ72_000408 [Mortierella alpina]
MAASAPEVAGGALTGDQPHPGGDHPTALSSSSSPSSSSSSLSLSLSSDAATHVTTATTATTTSIATDSSSSSGSSQVADSTLAFTLDSFPKPATALPQSKPTSTASTPRRILTPAPPHRRNQSQDHVTFSKFVPASPSALSTSFVNKPDLRINPLSPMARSSSMPVAGPAGHGVSTMTMSSIPTNAASAERETYTLSDRTSTVVQTTGQIPPPLIGSTSIIHRNRLYLFGGRPVGGNPTNDLYVLNLDSQIWTLIDQEEQQQRLQADEEHQSSGQGSEQTRQHPLSPFLQRFPETCTIHDTCTTVTIAAPTIPKPRYHHSAVLVFAPPIFDVDGSLAGWGDEDAAHMVIFGGRTFVEHDEGTERSGLEEKSDLRNTEFLNDTHILDLNTLRWIPSGLSPCLSHSNAGELPGKTLASGAGPVQEQQQHLGVKQPAASEKSDASLQPGGGPSSSTSEEARVLLRQSSWAQHQHNPFQYHTPRPRYGHVASLTGDHMIVIGGQGHDDECIQEISVLDLGRRVWLSGGEYHGQCTRCLSTVAGAEERPMARRRRRYLDRVAGEHAQDVGSPSALKSSSDSTPSSPSNIRGLEPPSPAAPAAMLPALLNPRKNSWHRGEGHPFDLPSLMPDHRQRFKSDSGLLTTMVQDDKIWTQDAKLQENLDLVKTHGLLGLGMDPEVSKAGAKSAGVSTTAQDPVARVRKPSIGTPSSLTMTQSTASSTISSSSSGSEKSRQRSQSQMSLPLQSPSSIRSGRGASQSPSLPVTHAVPPKFFTKSTGSMFDLDDLATTIARERKPSSAKSREVSTNRSQSNRDKDQALRRSNSNTASIGSSRRSSGIVEETKRPRSYRGQETDRKSEKRRSLDSAMEIAALPEEALDGKEPGLSKPSRVSAAVCQPLYVFSSHPDPADKPRHEFMKIQSSKGCCKPDRTKAAYDIKPEWTALDVGSSSAGGSEGLIPPRMLFPVGQVVDHYFLLSGASLEDSIPPATGAGAPPPLMPGDVAGSTLATALRRRHSYSVWMHHLHNHQWTQLELSKNLSHGEWNQSVLDRENNTLYILGQRDKDISQVVPMGLTPDDLTNLNSPEYATASFGDMIKVDLEGFEICPAVDEASIGPGGVKLGLEMLRDGVGADVVLVSSADGGRVRVNSGIVGQRWGYFQTLMQERARIRSMEAEERLSKLKSSDGTAGSDPTHSSTGTDAARDSLDHVPSTLEPKAPKGSMHRRAEPTSKQWYLGDQPAEIVVRETTPILVGFLQYIYTNDLATPHQLKLKTLQGLLLLSHFYDLTRLQQLVRRALYQQLNASNAPAICEVAVLTHEFGLQTRALRTLLQSARLAQLRQQGEAAEAKRRLEFAMSRLEEIEEDRKRKASMHANNIMLQQQQQIQQGLMSPGGSITRTGGGNSTLTTGSSNVLGRLASTASSTSASQTSTPGLSTIGRFFRHREESVESIGPVL